MEEKKRQIETMKAKMEERKTKKKQLMKEKHQVHNTIKQGLSNHG